MNNNITKSINKKKLCLNDLLVVKPCQFKFCMFQMNYTADLAYDLRRQKIKYSEPAIYDICPLLTLIYKSIKDLKIDFDKGMSFYIETKKFAKVLYKGETSVKENKLSSNLRKVMDLINEIDFAFPDIEPNKEKNQIIRFVRKQKTNCEVIISSKFKEYVENNILAERGCRLRVIPSLREFLSEIRHSPRAYVFFCEELYYRIQLKYHPQDAYREKTKKEYRIRQVFANEVSSHTCYVSEIAKAAHKVFDQHHIDFNESINRFKNEIENFKNQEGISSEEQFNKGAQATTAILMAKQSGCADKRLKDILSTFNLSERQLQSITKIHINQGREHNEQCNHDC